MSKIDHSSKTTPIDVYTRTMLIDSINQISGSLWERVGGPDRLTETSWIKELLRCVTNNFHTEAQHLRDLILNIYRGNIDERLRRYSGAERHLFNMKVKPQENCPIWSTLCLIYRSAEYQVNRKTKKSTGPLSGRGITLPGDEIERQTLSTTSDFDEENSSPKLL